MAHEIMRDASGRDCMVAFGRVPVWHGLGQRVEKLLTVDEAHELAGTDYPVETRPNLYRNNAGELVEGVGVQIVRPDTGVSLGYASKWYAPIHNRTAFTPIAELTGKGIAGIMTAGVLRNGEKAWMQGVIGSIGVDSVDQGVATLLVSNDHTGGGALKIGFVTTWVVCANTERAAQREWSKGGNERKVHSIMHLGDTEAAINAVAKTIDLARASFREWEATAKQLAAFRLDKPVAELYRLAVAALDVEETTVAKWREDPKAINRSSAPRFAQQIMREYLEAPGLDLASRKDTAWGAYNAITGWADFGLNHTANADSRIASMWFGGAASDIKDRAAKAAVDRYVGGKPWAPHVNEAADMLVTAGN